VKCGYFGFGSDSILRGFANELYIRIKEITYPYVTIEKVKITKFVQECRFPWVQSKSKKRTG